MSFHMKIGGPPAWSPPGLALRRRSPSRRRTVRVALGDVVSEETLAFIVALERAKDRGVELRADLLRRGGAGDPGDRRRPDGSRHRHALFGDPEDQGAAPHRLPDVGAGLLPGRLDRIRDLAGPGRPALHLQLARLGDGSLWRRHGGARRHRVRPALLRAGLGQPRHRAAERHHQGDHPRPLQQEQGARAGARQVPCAARRRGARQRRDPLRQRGVARRQHGNRHDRRRGAAEALARDEREPGHHRGGAR